MVSRRKCQNSEQGSVMKGISPHRRPQKATTCAHSLPILEGVSPLRVSFPGRVLSSDTSNPPPPAPKKSEHGKRKPGRAKQNPARNLLDRFSRDCKSQPCEGGFCITVRVIAS